VKKLEARSGEDSVPEEVRRAFIEPFRKAVGGALVLRERLVALADWPLASRDRTAAFAGGPLSHDRMLFRQSALGSFVADFMLARTGAEVAMINNLALRKTLDGLVSLDDVMESMPFMNSLVLIDLTGRQVDELARRNTFESRRFLQTSGLEMLYTPEAPQEAKILIAGKAIEPERRYRVVVNDYLATGARGRELIFSKAGTVFRTSTILNLAFIDLCSRMKILFAPGPSVFRMEPVREAKPIEDSVRALLGKGERREAFALLAQSALFSKDDKDVALLSGQERASFEGYLALLRRSPEEALARYTSALERYPGDREILISCGLLYFREGFLRKADALFTRAMEAGGKDGRDALPLLMRGLCRHGMYERKKSAADLEAAARTEPAARALLALTLLYDGDGEGARRHWALLAKGEWQKKKVEEILRLMEARR
jgi:tetratricopeptide (TPR) repeat protein